MLATPAVAALVAVDEDTVSFVDLSRGPGERNEVRVTGGGSTLTVTDTGAPLEAEGPGCVQISRHRARCTLTCSDERAGCGDRHFFSLEGGDDSLRLDAKNENFEVDAGPGADRVVSGTGWGWLYLDGGPGDDLLVGGPLNDWLTGGGGSDVIRGRGGLDLADYHRRREAVSVSLDRRANDGYAHERDDVRSADVRGGSGDDVIVGDRRRNYLVGGGGDDLLAGGGGADRLEGAEGGDALRGGAGPDRITAGTARISPYFGFPDGANASEREPRRDQLRCGRHSDVIDAGDEDSVAVDCERSFFGAVSLTPWVDVAPSSKTTTREVSVALTLVDDGGYDADADLYLAAVEGGYQAASSVIARLEEGTTTTVRLRLRERAWRALRAAGELRLRAKVVARATGGQRDRSITRREFTLRLS